MKIGLALSGGGARGIAHLGVLQALEEIGAKPQMISGSSAGALFGALYAQGYPASEILQFAKKTKMFRILRLAGSRVGLFRIEKLGKELGQYFTHNDFASLEIPLAVAATDITEGKSVIFEKGELIKAVLASCCMPVIFRPVEFNSSAYVDGGLLNNLPIEPLQASCSQIIGSHCNPVMPNFKVKHAKALLERTFLMAIRNNVLMRQAACDVFLEPPELGKYIGSDFGKADEIFDIGYKYTIAQQDSFNL